MILQNAPLVKSTLVKVRLIHIALLTAIPLFGWLAENIRIHNSGAWTWRHWLSAGAAVYVAWGGFYMRRRLVASSERVLATTADPKALKNWEAGQIIGMAMAEGIVTWGAFVRIMLGCALWQAALFYAAGLFLLLLWTPRLPATVASA